MSRVTVDTHELDLLAKDLAKAPDDKRKEAKTATQKVGRTFKARAQASAPRDRPWLATQGIHRKTWSDRTGVHVDVFTGMDERGVNVGFYVEYGTSDTPPQPFMAQNIPAAQADLEAALQRILNPFEPGDTSEVPD